MAKAKSQLIANPCPPLTPNGTATGAESGPSSSTGGPHTTTGIRPDLDKADNTSSHNISISSITEDEDGNPVSGHGDDGDGSSAFDSSSDSDSDLCDNEQIKKAIERIPNSLQPGSQMVRLPAAGPETSVVTATALQERPNIGSIAVQNSSDITFGNKTYIKGQVVIKNIYHDRKATNGVGGGVVNEGYREADGEAGLPSQTKKGKGNVCRGEIRDIEEVTSLKSFKKPIEASIYESIVLSLRCSMKKFAERFFWENIIEFFNEAISVIIRWLKIRKSNLVQLTKSEEHSTAGTLLDFAKAVNRIWHNYVLSKVYKSSQEFAPMTQDKLFKSLLIVSGNIQKILNILESNLKKPNVNLATTSRAGFIKTKNGKLINLEDAIKYVGLILENNPALKEHFGKIQTECNKYIVNLPHLAKLISENRKIKPF